MCVFFWFKNIYTLKYLCNLRCVLFNKSSYIVQYTELFSTYIKRDLCFQAVQEHFKRDTVIVCQNAVEQSLATYILSKYME